MNRARIHPISLVPILISFLVFHVGKNVMFFAGSPAKNVCAFFIFHMRAACRLHLIDYNMLIILGSRAFAT